MNLLVLKDPIRVISAKEGLNQNKVSNHIIMLLHNSWEGQKCVQVFWKLDSTILNLNIQSLAHDMIYKWVYLVCTKIIFKVFKWTLDTSLTPCHTAWNAFMNKYKGTYLRISLALFFFWDVSLGCLWSTTSLTQNSHVLNKIICVAHQ